MCFFPLYPQSTDTASYCSIVTTVININYYLIHGTHQQEVSILTFY